MTASHNREFMNYMELIFSLNPAEFTVKIPRGSTVGSRSRYYELYSEREVRELIHQEPNIEYIKFSRHDEFYGTIFPEDKYMKISIDAPRIATRVWSVLHEQNLGTYEVAIRLTSQYWRNLRESRRPQYT